MRNEERETRNFGKNPRADFGFYLMRADGDVSPYGLQTDKSI